MKNKDYTAQSIGDKFYQDLMEGSHSGQIHSVYPNAINMEINGNVYCIVKAKVGNGPCTMMLPPLTENLDLLGLHSGDLVQVDHGVLCCQDMEIAFADAEVWNSQWDEVLFPDRLFRMIPQVKALAVREGNLKGLGMLLIPEEEQLDDERTMDYAQIVLLEQALPMVEAIRQSLISDPTCFWDMILNMVGLGPGKTPAGDDFLMGLILMFRYLETGGYISLPGVNIRDFVQEIMQRTNVISATGLVLALENKPFELIKDFIENMSNGKKVHTILSALRLIDRGTSSGTDILTGILVAGEIYQEIYYIYQRRYI